MLVNRAAAVEVVVVFGDLEQALARNVLPTQHDLKKRQHVLVLFRSPKRNNQHGIVRGRALAKIFSHLYGSMTTHGLGRRAPENRAADGSWRAAVARWRADGKGAANWIGSGGKSGSQVGRPGARPSATLRMADPGLVGHIRFAASRCGPHPPGRGSVSWIGAALLLPLLEDYVHWNACLLHSRQILL